MNTADTAENVSGAHDRATIDQVRELLFGGYVRELERKLARLEARLGSDSESIREELRRRFGELEAHVRNEIETLSARIDAEATARVDALSQLGKETREAGTSLELRVNRVDEAGARAQRDLRRQLLEQSKALGEQIARARDELFSALDAGRRMTTEQGGVFLEQQDRTSVH